MRRFRSRPVEIDAILHDGSEATGGQIVDGAGPGAYLVGFGDGWAVMLPTNNGIAMVKPGHWAIRGPHDWYPCDPQTFGERWEPVA